MNAGQWVPGTPPSTGEPFTIDLHGCARCDGDGHPGIEFQPLTRPIEAEGVAFTHWAPCPSTGEPIVVLVRS